ncbi:hypothetical protein DTO96_102153 [Ephemeroptericola cinctiostellae]|uniref:Phage tail protein n=1 Tax=Ephemeroptericola cinctiostellae TaxID=2268024 RepID=A0A345DDG1_9BURK|nr:phage tail protein [Ephemeroptericola cinctiostellae]AXF86399.1 hypothetical protein DTO96_102153 [Ephemeroptericola cinctiostellae]
MNKTAIAEIISTQYLIPGVFNKFDPSSAMRGPREMPRSIALFGPINNPLFNPANFDHAITLTTDAAARGMLGAASIGYQMWKAAKANAIKGLPIRFVAQRDDATAVARVVTITISVGAPASRQNGEQAIYIGGERYSVGILSTDSAAAIAEKFAAKLNTANNLFSVLLVGNVMTLKAKTKGQLANLIDFRTRYYRTDELVSGVTVSMKTTVNGAVNPSISAAIANLAKTRDTEWVIPYTDGANMGILEAELMRRWGQEVQSDVQAIVAMRGTEGAHTTWLKSRNCPLVHSIHTNKDMSSPWELASMAGATIESMAMLDPATPHTGAALVGYKPAATGESLNEDQINNIMLEGGSSVSVHADNTATLMRMVTNYTTHNTGAYDTSMRELNWIKTLSWFRWYRNAEFSIKTQGFKMGEYAEAIPGQKIMTYDVAQDMLLGIYDNAIGIGRMQNPEYYKDTLLIQIDGPQGRLKIRDEPVIMNQLYQTAITSQWVAGHV